MTTTHDREIQLEDEALSMGIDRYRNILTIKGHADTGVGQRLMRITIDPLTTAITQYIKDGTGGKPGRRNAAAMLIKDVSPQSMAFLTCRVVLQGISSRRSAAATGNLIGHMLAEHLDWIHLRKEEKGLAVKVERQLKKSTNETHRRSVCRHVLAKHCPLGRVDWDERESMSVGMVLLELLIQSTSLVEYRPVKKGKNRYTNFVFASDETLEFLTSQHASKELLSPMYMPMVVKPQPWTAPTNGGYLKRRTWVVKTTNRRYLDELFNVELDEVYSALNAIQDTAWKINTQVLDVLSVAWLANDQFAGLPNREKLELPAKPVDIDTNEEACKAWKRNAAAIYESNALMVSAVISMSRKLHLADKFKDDEAIYFPHTLDWRGRVYPMPIDLQPQGDDMAKSLLHFAEGKPLGAEGSSYLFIHVANLFGIDKVPFGDRIQWVTDNMDELLACALNPQDTEMWKQADKPWQALAALFELLGWSVHGEDYVSHLPIAMDGSCNGLQNLSAMLLDEEGGKATNLLPADVPQDIYTLVLDRVMESVKEIASIPRTLGDDSNQAQDWADRWLAVGINRNLIKRPVMTKPYGVTMFGMRDQLVGEMRKQKLVADEDLFKMATFLAPLVDDAISKVVVASKEVMAWLQESAKVAAQENLPLYWTTPCGLPVLQDYRNHSSKNVKIRVGSQVRQFRMNLDTDGINGKKQALGMSPNVIHSLDASHLMKTVNLTAAEGITSFAMVHDSYATHACDTGTLSMLLRFAFVEIYNKDVIGDLHQQFLAQVSPEIAVDMPTPPAKGNLDLNRVEESLYFFA